MMDEAVDQFWKGYYMGMEGISPHPAWKSKASIRKHLLRMLKDINPAWYQEMKRK